jgi:hypothetical protein
MLSLESVKPAKIDRTNRDWVLLHCSTLDEVDSAIKDKGFIHSHIIRGVKRMLQRRATSDMCLEIWCQATFSSIWVSIRLEEAAGAIQKILDWRVAEENYEECAECVELLEEIAELEAEVARARRSP